MDRGIQLIYSVANGASPEDFNDEDKRIYADTVLEAVLEHEGISLIEELPEEAKKDKQFEFIKKWMTK